jgi:hypothetical protein
VGGPGSGPRKAPGRGPHGELTPLSPDRAPVTPPRPPKGLSGDARRLWRQLWVDVAAFRARVADDGPMIEGSKGQLVAHPLIAEIRKSLAQLETWAGYLALRPDMRARLGLTVARTANELDELTHRRRRRARGPARAEVITPGQEW